MTSCFVGSSDVDPAEDIWTRMGCGTSLELSHGVINIQAFHQNFSLGEIILQIQLPKESFLSGLAQLFMRRPCT
jgi:hypothetical protein